MGICCVHGCLRVCPGAFDVCHDGARKSRNSACDACGFRNVELKYRARGAREPLDRAHLEASSALVQVLEVFMSCLTVWSDGSCSLVVQQNTVMLGNASSERAVAAGRIRRKLEERHKRLPDRAIDISNDYSLDCSSC